MNISQRNYTVKRLQQLHEQKTSALFEENNVLVGIHNNDYKITYEEALAVIATNPELVKTSKNNNDVYCGVYTWFDEKNARKLLNKPSYVLDVVRDRGYLTSEQQKLNTHEVIKTCFGNRVVLKEIAERITKLNHRIAFAKDQVMLGDSHEALKALEEINSLVF
jgi:hypothetical protein